MVIGAITLHLKERNILLIDVEFQEFFLHASMTVAAENLKVF